MSLLLALIAASSITDPPDPPDPPTVPPIVGDTTPYAMPTAKSYRVPTYAVTPTPDGTGSAVHPSVVDFATMHGQATWNGHRFWMAMTPYRYSNEALENPAILASHDGYTWVVPAGLTNPIQAAPPTAPVIFNSDTDLAYDAANDRLVCYWRETDKNALTETIHAATSTDGSTWTKHLGLITVTSSNGTRRLLSPAVVRDGSGVWHMFGIGLDVGAQVNPCTHRTASSPLGPWSAPTNVTLQYVTGGQSPWHMAAYWTGTKFHLLMDGLNQGGLYCATSDDGNTWRLDGQNTTEPITGVTGQWDQLPYRGTLTPHENGTHYRVWYSAQDAGSPADWKIGYTWLPRNLWPA